MMFRRSCPQKIIRNSGKTMCKLRLAFTPGRAAGNYWLDMPINVSLLRTYLYPYQMEAQSSLTSKMDQDFWSSRNQPTEVCPLLFAINTVFIKFLACELWIGIILHKFFWISPGLPNLPFSSPSLPRSNHLLLRVRLGWCCPAPPALGVWRWGSTWRRWDMTSKLIWTLLRAPLIPCTHTPLVPRKRLF